MRVRFRCWVLVSVAVSPVGCILRQAQDERGLFFGKAGFSAGGGLCSTSLSAHGRGTQLFFPTFSCTQHARGAPARGHGQSRWSRRSAAGGRWSGLTEPCRVRPVAIFADGVGRRSEILPLKMKIKTAVLPWLYLGYMFWRGVVKESGVSWVALQFGWLNGQTPLPVWVRANDYSPLRRQATSTAMPPCHLCVGRSFERS